MKNKDLMKDILLGMAVGDAFGVPYEFLSREEAGRRVTESMQGWGTHNQPPGTWSDDTSLVLCTADAMTKGYHVGKVAQNFVKWLDEGFWTPHGKASRPNGLRRLPGKMKLWRCVKSLKQFSNWGTIEET